MSLLPSTLASEASEILRWIKGMPKIAGIAKKPLKNVSPRNPPTPVVFAIRWVGGWVCPVSELKFDARRDSELEPNSLWAVHHMDPASEFLPLFQ